MPVLVSSLPPDTAAIQSTAVTLASWACCAFYKIDQGLRQVPACGPPGTPSRIVRQHGGKATKVIRWLAMGWGGVPPLPSMDTGSANEVLAHWQVGQPAAGKLLDGLDMVAVFGEYEYFLQQAPAPSDVLTFCAAPYQSTPNVAVYQLTPADFNGLFVGPSQAPAGSYGDQVNY